MQEKVRKMDKTLKKATKSEKKTLRKGSIKLEKNLKQ